MQLSSLWSFLERSHSFWPNKLHGSLGWIMLGGVIVRVYHQSLIWLRQNLLLLLGLSSTALCRADSRLQPCALLIGRLRSHLLHWERRLHQKIARILCSRSQPSPLLNGLYQLGHLDHVSVLLLGVPGGYLGNLIIAGRVDPFEAHILFFLILLIRRLWPLL